MTLEAAAAAALSAFEVPGLFDAELKLPKRFVGFGATILALGREVAAGVTLLSAAGSCGRLEDRDPLVPSTFVPLLALVARFLIGKLLPSASFGRFVPARSAPAPFVVTLLDVAFLLGEFSLGVGLPCFRLVEAAALSMIFWASSLVSCPLFLTSLEVNNFVMFVLLSVSSSVTKRDSNCIRLIISLMYTQ